MRLSGIAILAIGTSAALAQNPGSLKDVPVPRPAGLNKYVRDPARLVELGKALFWDMQAGSDGRTACATCHFHAGADHRSQNQLANSQSSSGGQVSVNRLLTSQDFPFHALSNPDDNRSAVL